MESFLLKGVLIGLLFELPVGAIGAMTVQRTLEHGARAGFITGLGSSAADCLYACVGAFGLTLISDFLLANQLWINICGGSLILVMGILMMAHRNKPRAVEMTAITVAKMFLSSFAVGITNPAVILTFLFAFTYFGLAGQMSAAGGVQLVVGVLLGTLIWWIVLVVTSVMLKRKRGERGFKNMNKLFGCILIVFGAVVFFKTTQL